MAQMMVAMAPQLSTAELAVVVEVGLAIFAFDDLVDEADLDVSELALRAEQLAECASGGDCPEVAFDPLANMVRGIAARLRAAPLGQALGPQWSRAFSASLRAMVQQRRFAERLQAGGELSLTEHCAVGSASYGLAAVATATWMFLGDASVSSHLATLDAAEFQFALAARLANDLRSEARESDGRSCNVLFLQDAPSRDEVRAMITRSLTAGRELLGTLPPAAQRTAGLLERLAVAIVGLYSKGDFGEPLAYTSQTNLAAAA